MKKLQTPEQEKRMWRNAAIRKEFKELIEAKSAKTACHLYLAEKYKLTETQIRNILAEKGLDNE